MAGLSLDRSISEDLRQEREVIWEQIGVYANLNDTCDRLSSFPTTSMQLIPGGLSVVKHKHGISIEWKVEDELPDWELTDSVCFNGKDDSGSIVFKSTGSANGCFGKNPKLDFNLDIHDLKSFKLCQDKKKSDQTTIKFICKDGSSCLPLVFKQGGTDALVEVVQRYLSLKRSVKDNDLILVSDPRADQLQKSVNMLLEEGSQAFVSKLLSNPYTTALSGLGKVSTFVADTLMPALLNFDELNVQQQTDVSKRLKELQEQADEADKLNIAETDSFQLVTKQIELPQRPSVPRGPALTADKWKTLLTQDGRVVNNHELRAIVFRGGVSRSIRQEVWKFLLGYHSFNSTYEERKALKQTKVDEYYRMKLQWKSVSEEQEEQWSGFRDRKAIVDKDVTRTDRSHPFFQGDDNAHVQLLYDVLMTYNMYNYDLGYVQGMSDLLSPIIVVMENEVDSFWCFVGFMNRVKRNFEMDQQHIKTQLRELRDILMIVNPGFLNYLESHDSDNMFFCFRWILVLFKREFSIDDSMILWEVLWSDLPCRNFHFLICLAILDAQETVIRENKFGFTEILKHINELSMRLRLDDILKRAEGIYHQLAVVQDTLPVHICKIFGFTTLCLSPDEPSPPVMLNGAGSSRSSSCYGGSSTKSSPSPSSATGRRPPHTRSPSPTHPNSGGQSVASKSASRTAVGLSSTNPSQLIGVPVMAATRNRNPNSNSYSEPPGDSGSRRLLEGEKGSCSSTGSSPGAQSSSLNGHRCAGAGSEGETSFCTSLLLREEAERDFDQSSSSIEVIPDDAILSHPGSGMGSMMTSLSSSGAGGKRGSNNECSVESSTVSTSKNGAVGI